MYEVVFNQGAEETVSFDAGPWRMWGNRKEGEEVRGVFGQRRPCFTHGYILFGEPLSSTWPSYDHLAKLQTSTKEFVGCLVILRMVVVKLQHGMPN